MEVVIILLVAALLIYLYADRQEKIKRQQWEEERQRVQRKHEDQKTKQLLQEKAEETRRLQQQERERQRRVQEAKAVEDRAKSQREAEQKAQREVEANRQRELAEKQAKFLKQQQLDQENQIAQKRQQVLQESQQQAEKERLAEEQRQQENLQRESFDAFWHFVGLDASYCEDLRSSIKTDNSQPFSVYQHIQKLSKNYQVWDQLGNGVNILTTHEQLSQYIFSYGKMHKAKLYQAFGSFIPEHFNGLGNCANIIDYGCGQGLGTVALIDFLNAYNCTCDYTKITLIEPSVVALRRASTHVVISLENLTWPAHTYQQIFPIQKKINDISLDDLETRNDAVKFHVFSNILDIAEVNINILCDKIARTQKGINYFICVSPNFFADGSNTRNQRIRDFFSYFKVQALSHRFTNIGTWTRYEIVFMVDFNNFNSHKDKISHRVVNISDDDLPF